MFEYFAPPFFGNLAVWYGDEELGTSVDAREVSFRAASVGSSSLMYRISGENAAASTTTPAVQNQLIVKPL